MAIGNASVSSNSMTATTVSWDVTGSPSYEYVTVRFSLSNDAGDSSTIAGTVAKATESLSHTGLTAGTTYYYYIHGSTADGTVSGNDSDTASGTTGNVPDKPGATLTVVSRKEISIVVTAPANNYGSDITSYTMQQKKGKYGTWETLTGLSLPGTITRNNLSHDTLYSYRVSATNGYGASGISEVYGTTIKPTGRMAITATRKTPVTGNNVTLSWTTPKGYTDTEITSDSDKYYIYYLYDEDKALLHTSSSLNDKSVDPFNMGSRDKNKDYYFAVTFHVNSTKYHTTALKKFNYNGPPDVPAAPIPTIISDNTIDIYWQTPVSYSKDIDTYDLRYSIDGGTNWISSLLSDDQSHIAGSGQRYSHTNVGYQLQGYTLADRTRNTAKDYATLYAAGNTSPLDITGTSTTLWVLDTVDSKLYAYTVAAGARASNSDISLHTDNAAPTGITTNGTTMWVADSADEKLYAYAVTSKTRDADKDVTLDSANTDPKGLWSNSTHIYVLDSDLNIYSYEVDGDRASANDIEPAGDVLINPVSIYSDGITLWISDSSDNELYAYVLSSGARDSGKDIDPGMTPRGIHSDGTTLWVLGIPGNNYSYSVLASNDYGSSAYSDASAGIKILIPSDLTSLEASATGENTILLTWDVPGTAEFITSFVVERSADSGATWTIIKSSATAADINLLKDGDVYKYTDTQLEANTSYKYRVKATNTTGSGNYYESESVKTSQLPGRSAKPIFRTDYQGSYKFGN